MVLRQFSFIFHDFGGLEVIFGVFLSILVIFVQHFSHARRLLVAKYEIWGAIWVVVRNLGILGAFHIDLSHIFVIFWPLLFNFQANFSHLRLRNAKFGSQFG